MGRFSRYFGNSVPFHSNYAKKHGIDNTTKNPNTLANIYYTGIKVVDPIYRFFKTKDKRYSVIIESWYRNKIVNKGVKGDRNSGHLSGKCVDLAVNFEGVLVPPGQWWAMLEANMATQKKIDRLPFDIAIVETGKKVASWNNIVHLGISKSNYPDFKREVAFW